MGFTTPLAEWFFNQSSVKLNSNLLKKNQNLINESLKKHKNNNENNRILLWNLINLDNFLSKNNH